MYTRGNRQPLSGRMLRDSVVCSAESHRNWQRRHKSLLPPNIHKKSERQGHRKWIPIGQFPSRWQFVCCFVKIFARICLALTTSSHWYCPDDSSVKVKCPRNQAWVRHSMSSLWNHISAWNMTFQVVAHFEVSIGDQFLSVEFWHVNNSGLCTSHIEFAVTVHGYWGMAHWLCIWKSQAKNILNHYWFVVLFKKLSSISMWWYNFQNTPWKYPFSLTSHLGIILILEGVGCLQNWSSVNKPQGQKVSYRGRKCIVPGA